MTALPITNRLRIARHRKVAVAQDILVVSLYAHFPNAVIHGGTALWRCYGGNRFSEDIDVYLDPDDKNANFGVFVHELETRGLEKIKFKKSKTSIFSAFAYDREHVAFEAVFKHVVGTPVKYEMSDGTFIFVRTLTPKELMLEKIVTYLDRKKIRDLYDMYFLSSIADADESLRRHINPLTSRFIMPVDTDTLSSLVLTGAVPTVDEMVGRLKLWAK